MRKCWARDIREPRPCTGVIQNLFTTSNYDGIGSVRRLRSQLKLKQIFVASTTAETLDPSNDSSSALVAMQPLPLSLTRGVPTKQDELQDCGDTYTYYTTL